MDFNALLQQAQRLTNETLNSEELPHVERSITNVLQDTNELHSRLYTQTGAQDIQANILLGSAGVDLPKLSQKLESLSARKTFEPLDPIDDTNVQSFLKNEKENAILSVIEEVNRNTYQSAEKRKWDLIRSEWEQEKIKILNSLIGPSQNWLDIQKQPEQTVLNETFGANTCLNRIEMAYARVVFEYNSIVNKGGHRPNLVSLFSKVSFEDQKVQEIWDIMKAMVNVTPVSRNRDPIQSRVQMTEFIDQAKKYLENRYKIYMSTIINENLREAQRGGVPSVYNMVSSFVGLASNQANFYGLQDGNIDGKPLWPLVYFSLRSGDIESAYRFLQLGGIGNEYLIQILEDKINKPEQKIDLKLEGQLKLHYCNKIKNSTDPYKKAVYCVLAACDINEQHSQVTKTTDDFLWLQLSLLRDGASSTGSSDVLTYSSLQKMILEQYGEKHFNAGEQQHLYFQVLALTGQFEAAIEFLARTEKYRTHAVHIALALNEMFLIGGPRNVQEPLLSIDIEDPVPMRRLNIARLVMLYVKKFEITDPAEALQYYFFLRNLRDPTGRNLFLVCVCDLAIECRNYDLIFGTMQPNGMACGGLFEQFNCVDFDTKTAAAMVGEELVRKGLFEDAIKLFDIAEMPNQSLRYISILLSQVVHQTSVQGSLRERLAIMSAHFNNRLRGNRIECEPQVVITFVLLNQLVTFFDYFHEQKYQAAMEVLASTKLVPMSMNELDECVTNFKRLSGEICKVYPDILLAAMDILYAQYKDVKGKDSSMVGDGQLQRLRQQAKAFTNMAATIPYRLPGDTNKKLVQTEILMH